MASQDTPFDVTELELHENTLWSTTRLYLSLLELFPKYVADFQAKWNAWQQAISTEECVLPESFLPPSPTNTKTSAHPHGPRSRPSRP